MKLLIKHYGPLTAAEPVYPQVPDGDGRESLNLAPGDLMIIAIRITRVKDGTPVMAESERYTAKVPHSNTSLVEKMTRY